MRALTLEGGVYRVQEYADPKPAPHEVLVRVSHAGVNRADLLQKQGRYPLPKREPAIPGMEISGEVLACGKDVSDFKPGEKVCALLAEGAFAELAGVDARHVLPVPSQVTLAEAAALPEACFTVWISLVWQAHLAKGESVLIHGAASGIGSMAIQIARHLGARVFATAGSPKKCALALKLGAERAIAYREEDYAASVLEATDGKGVDVILDMVGGDYFERNLSCLAQGGRLAIIAFLKGAKVQANLAPILLKHLSVMGSTLRARPAEQKAQLAMEIREGLWDPVAAGTIKPVLDRVFALEEAENALNRMDQGLNIGKILLKM